MPDSRLPTPDSRLPTPDSRLPTPVHHARPWHSHRRPLRDPRASRLRGDGPRLPGLPVAVGRRVAIKVLQESADAPAELHERFLRESRAAAQLRHPGIVGILDFGVDASRQPYMVMELLSGPSLHDEIALHAPMPPERVAAILLDWLRALQLAHDRGITHRDLKPANIVRHRYESGQGVYKIIDFGLAVIKSSRDSTRLTDPNLFVGTMAYAAPEQVRGEPITSAADVYAMGVIAYEMLTAVRPFDASRSSDC